MKIAYTKLIKKRECIILLRKNIIFNKRLLTSAFLYKIIAFKPIPQGHYNC